MTSVGGRGKESMWLHMPSLLAFCLKCFTTSFAFEHNSIQYCVVLLKMFFERTDEFVVLTTIRTRKGSVFKHFKRLERLLRRESFSIGFVAWKDNLCQGLAVLGPLNTSWVWKTERSKIDFFQNINNQPSSIRRFFSLAWFLMSIRYMKNLRIIKSGIKYIIKNIYQTNLASFIPRHCVYLFIHAKVWVITYFVNKHQCKIRNAKNSKMPARTLEYLLHPALSTSRGHTILDNTFLCAPFW